MENEKERGGGRVDIGNKSEREIEVGVRVEKVEINGEIVTSLPVPPDLTILPPFPLSSSFPCVSLNLIL